MTEPRWWSPYGNQPPVSGHGGTPPFRFPGPHWFAQFPSTYAEEILSKFGIAGKGSVKDRIAAGLAARSVAKEEEEKKAKTDELLKWAKVMEAIEKMRTLPGGGGWSYNKQSGKYGNYPSGQQSMQGAADEYNKGLDVARYGGGGGAGGFSASGNPELDAMIQDVMRSGNPQMEAEVRRNFSEEMFNRRNAEVTAEQQRQMTTYETPSTWLEYAQASQESGKVPAWMTGLSGLKEGGELPGWQGRTPQMYATGYGQMSGADWNARMGNVGSEGVEEWEAGKYDVSKLPQLQTPSMQYLARMAPTERSQYLGYQKVKTGTRDEDIQNKLWGNIPSGANTGLRWLR